MAKKKIVALGGDGIGPEVVDATCHVLGHAGFDLEILKPPNGEAVVEKYGTAFPEETKKLCNEADAVLFGATAVASQTTMIYLRWLSDNYVNIRPTKYYPGAYTCLKDATGIDFVFLRENSEGLIPGREGDLSLLVQRLPEYRDPVLDRPFAYYGEGKFAVRIVSQRGTERLAKFACEYALQRKKKGCPGKVTSVHKWNAFPESDRLFERIIREEVAKHPELSYDNYLVDDMARRILRYPKDFDVIVIDNMFGDILSDEASELVGGLGIAPSGNVGSKVPYFESVAGSAPKYAGKNVVNPTATILSAKLMLETLGMHGEADALERAVAAVYKEGKHLTFDQGGSASTIECAQAILGKLR
jgi:isocitrate/isopropylmalate dehydrogenase